MAGDPTRRFSSRVEDYVKYRPSYPAEIIVRLESECGLAPASVVADIGSGTGLLAELFLRFGCRVYGIEPNEDMRLAGERILGSFLRFSSVAGRAEQTTLAASSVDFITAGQAFHWFVPDETRAEFARILRPEGWVALVWNERLVAGEAFLTGYEALLHQYAPEYAQVDHRRIDGAAIARFFGHDRWRDAVFENSQTFDYEALCGRLRSSSYTPQPGSPSYGPMMREVENLFARCQTDGRVRFLYDTKLYYGRLG
jgi:SAM-dependent methyltransferase